MKDGSIFSNAYQQVLSEINVLRDEERNFSASNEHWQLELCYFYKFNHLHLEFTIHSTITAIDFPRFDLYKSPMKLFGLFAIGLYSGHLDGKMSDLSDHFCELKSTDFLLNQTDAHLGWENQAVIYMAKLNQKQTENLIHVFNCIEFTCVHSVSLLEVL